MISGASFAGTCLIQTMMFTGAVLAVIESCELSS
jgi:hypothetical protein